MGGNQATEEADTPKPGKPVGSMALTLFGDENLSVGEQWSTGLFDCHENQSNAIVTACLPCVTFGQIAEIVDGGEMTCPLGTYIYMLMMPPLCSQWIMGSKYRAKLRKKYGLVEAPYEDVVSHVLCPCCSLCQEFRELKNRGFDPALESSPCDAQTVVRMLQGKSNVKATLNDGMESLLNNREENIKIKNSSVLPRDK